MAVKCSHCDRSVEAALMPSGRTEVSCPHCGSALFTILDVRIPRQEQEKDDHDVQMVGEPAVAARSAVSLVGDGTSDRRRMPPRNDFAGRLTEPGGFPTPPPVGYPDARHHVRPAGSCANDVPQLDTTTLTGWSAAASLPGYRIERCLGYGGMGAVFLARQLSLDRLVAVKVMSASWAVDPVFVARFTREAYAAALLNHPNVVQIYDIGETDGTRFFSMEYVPGKSLAELVRISGRVEPERAVGFILQAARGLQHAHERGLIHRDVKPDNLLLTEQGLVKVADLGLVKTPGLARVERPGRRVLDETDSGSGLASLPPGMTGHRIALGTPAYMAPEQCRDASEVDHRADIYSLGCTLYVLVTGQPPFEGESAVDLMTKHAYQPLVPPEQISTRVPKELSAIIQKMMDKERDQRYQTMAEVVCVLEKWLGVYHTGGFTPENHDIERVERYSRIFQTAPTAKLRDRLVTSLLSSCSLAAVLMMFFGRLDWAFGFAGMILHAAGLYFVLNGVARKTYFFGRVNQFLLGLSIWDWGVAAAGVCLFGLLLWNLGLIWVWVSFGLFGAGLAIALRYGFDRTIDQERYVCVAKCQKLVQRLRVAGISEDDIRQFVAKHSGKQWEEFFEAVFDFEAKLATRVALLRAGNTGEREKFAAWREPIVAFLDRVDQQRREDKDREMLERVEKARLLAAGVTVHSATDQAAAAAGTFIDRTRTVGYRSHFPGTGPSAVQPSPIPGQPGETGTSDQPNTAKFERLLDHFLQAVRLGFAIVFLISFAVWAGENDPIGRAKFLISSSDEAAGFRDRLVEVLQTPTESLSLRGVPNAWTKWCDTVNVGVAGLILLISFSIRGFGASVLLMLGALLMVFGHHLGIRTVEPLRDYHVALLLGLSLTLLGLRIGRS